MLAILRQIVPEAGSETVYSVLDNGDLIASTPSADKVSSGVWCERTATAFGERELPQSRVL